MPLEVDDAEISAMNCRCRANAVWLMIRAHSKAEAGKPVMVGLYGPV